jgi:hypothetical protein
MVRPVDQARQSRDDQAVVTKCVALPSIHGQNVTVTPRVHMRRRGTPLRAHPPCDVAACLHPEGQLQPALECEG